jgi:hypothetical protein
VVCAGGPNGVQTDDELDGSAPQPTLYINLSDYWTAAARLFADLRDDRMFIAVGVASYLLLVLRAQTWWPALPSPFSSA